MVGVCQAGMTVVEGMMSGGARSTVAPSEMRTAFAVLLAVLLSLLIIAFLGRWLWNNSVVPLIPTAKPAKSVMPILGLYVFLRLIMPCM